MSIGPIVEAHKRREALLSEEYDPSLALTSRPKKQIYPATAVEYVRSILYFFKHNIMGLSTLSINKAIKAIVKIRPEDSDEVFALSTGELAKGLEDMLYHDFPRVLAHVIDLREAERGRTDEGNRIIESRIYTNALHTFKWAVLLHTAVEMYNRNLADVRGHGNIADYQGPKLEEVALAALLMNYGMLHPEVAAVLDSSKGYTPKERETMAKHPAYSAEMVEANGMKLSPIIRKAILLHNRPIDAVASQERNAPYHYPMLYAETTKEAWLTAEIGLAEMINGMLFGGDKKDIDDILAVMRKKAIGDKYAIGYALSRHGDYDAEDFGHVPTVPIYQMAYRLIEGIKEAA